MGNIPENFFKNILRDFMAMIDMFQAMEKQSENGFYLFLIAVIQATPTARIKSVAMIIQIYIRISSEPGSAHLTPYCSLISDILSGIKSFSFIPRMSAR